MSALGWTESDIAKLESRAILAELENERLRASNAALVAAAVAFDSCLSIYCDGPERDALRTAIAAAKGGA